MTRFERTYCLASSQSPRSNEGTHDMRGLALPNGLRLSGDGGEADGVRCSRGLGDQFLFTPVSPPPDSCSNDQESDANANPPGHKAAALTEVKDVNVGILDRWTVIPKQNGKADTDPQHNANTNEANHPPQSHILPRSPLTARG